MRMKIINVMSQSPAYELFWNDTRPDIYWETPDGRWVGIAGYDWADLIGKEVLKLTDEFEYEVWQPDLRVDKIYSHTFSNGLTHRLFPAVKRQKHYGLKPVEYVVSQSICDNLLDESHNNKVVLHLNGINSGISRSIVDLLTNSPLIVVFFGEVKSPLHRLFRFKKNLPSKLNDIGEHFTLKQMFKKVDVVGYCNERSRATLGRYFRGEMKLLPVGIDFDYWTRQSDKRQARATLGLGNGDFILLSSSRFNSLKQIDKVIDVLENLDHNSRNFQHVVTGHGDEKYERYLARKGDHLMKQGKLKFVGFLPEEELVEYYNAADLFVITSLSEGAPVSAIKAMAMELPIFSTDTGLVAELLNKCNVGEVVPLKDYKMWGEKLREILNGKKVGVIQRDVAESLFHWPNVARKYLSMYRDLFNNYYDKEST